MSSARQVMRTRRPAPAQHSASPDLYENDAFENDYPDDSSPNDRYINSPTDVDLIRTRDLQQRTRSTKSYAPTSTSGLLIAGGILLLVVILIVVPTAIVIILTRNPTVSSNTTTTTIAPSYYTLFWSFDNTTSDLNGTFNATLLNGATYSSNTYFGYGYNLALNSSFNQSMTVTSPFLNLSYSSFTVEAWIYGNTFSGDSAILGQCQCSSCQRQCLYLLIRNSKMYMGFLLDDLVGSTSLSASTWYHVAYVYDYSVQTQYLYLQGVLDNSKSSSGPYQGQNGSLVFGSSYLSSSTFNGYIDSLKITTRAKAASELLYDASVVVYFSFDGPTLGQDMGPNQLNGTLSNVGVINGMIGQGLLLSGSSSSYLQIYGFYQLGQSNKAFSFAMWLYPYSVTGGTLIHKTNTQFVNSSWCQDMMGFTYAGQIAFHVNGVNPQIVGPFVPTFQWTHVAFTYSQTNGQTLYINGALFLTTTGTSFTSSGSIDWLTIGYDFGSCSPSPQIGGYYFGILDEFYVYRRELTASDVSSLASA